MDKESHTSASVNGPIRLESLFHREKMRIILRYIGGRFKENHLADVAGSMSFTLILSLVPILAIALAVFTRFPAFGSLQQTLNSYFSQGMIPPSMAKNILNYLNSFAANAASVSVVGTIALFFTAISTISTIERAFNQIWHVTVKRTMAKKALLFIIIAFVVPLLFGVSIYLTTHLLLSKHGLIGWMTFLNGISSYLLSMLWTSMAFTMCYVILPNRPVLWRDAFAGGLFASIAFEIAIRIFAFFIIHFSSYQHVYGALAAFPIFMLWIYISCYIVLLGAMVAAIFPEIRNGRWLQTPQPGNGFNDVMRLIVILTEASKTDQPGVTRTNLEQRTHLSMAEVENALSLLQTIGWVCVDSDRLTNSLLTRSNQLQKWRWIGDTTQILLSDVFRQFAYCVEDDSALSQKIDQIIDDNLNISLQTYLDEQGHTIVSALRRTGRMRSLNYLFRLKR